MAKVIGLFPYYDFVFKTDFGFVCKLVFFFIRYTFFFKIYILYAKFLI